MPVYAQQIKFSHLSLQDGLSQATIYTILQDHKGFMWFGTRDGLNKYDGYEFTHYRHDPHNPASLSNSFILSTYQDQEGVLWIGTEGGLNKYNRQLDKFVRYQHDPQNPTSLSSDVVLSIYEDSSGALWISTGGGLNKYDRQQNKFVHYQNDPQDPDSLSSDAVWRVFEDHTGTLWVGTDGAGLNKFDHEQNKFIHYQHDPNNPASLSNDKVTSIYEDSTGVLWIGTEYGLNQFDRQHNNFRHYFHDPQNQASLSNSNIWAICEDSAGVLWIGTDGGLNQFKRQQNQFDHYIHNSYDPKSLSNNFVMALYVDKAGALWIGTDGGGLNKFDRRENKFKHYLHNPQNPDTLNNNLVSSIYEDSTGALWVGTLGGGLNKFDNERQTVTHYQHDPQNPNSLNKNEVWSIYEDRDGTLWIGTFDGGLNKFDRQQHKFEHYKNDFYNPNSLSDDKVMAIYQDKAGTLWIGTRGGLNKFDSKAKKFWHYYFEPNNPVSLSNDNILSIHEDQAGMLWIGTQGGGLNKFDREQNKFWYYQNDPDDPTSLTNNAVLAIHEDKIGTLWIGTLGGGLNKFDRKTETFTHYREQDGLPNDVIYGILEDEPGNLWLSTNGGLSKFNPTTNQFRNYDVFDGLQSNEFRGAYHKSRSGELFFGGINGFNAFYPQHIKDNSYIPPVVITDFKIFNKPVKIGKDSALQYHINETQAMTLSYEQSFFTFEFAALNFLLPEKNQYKYLLEGFDNHWNEVGTRRKAFYTKVPYGTYAFRVKGSNNDNLFNDAGTALKITILPPPWQTWWAYALYIITITVIILNYIWSQKRKLLEKQRELERERKICSQKRKLLEKQRELEREQKIAAQLKEAERIKDEHKNRLMQFLESMPIGIEVVGVSGNFSYHNQKAMEIFGNRDFKSQTIEKIASAYQLYIANTEQLYPTDKLPLVQALNGESSIIDDAEIHSEDNKVIPLEIRGNSIFDSNGDVIYAINVFQDITERKMVMESQERFTQELFQFNQAYERFVPREFLSLLDKQSVLDVKLGDQVEKEITVLFSDIRGFTAISETMNPQENFNFINAYLSLMEPIIRQHHGFIDKYIGDAIMALFPTSADDAVHAAIAMLKQLVNYNEGRQRGGYQQIAIGIGLNTGPLMLGTVGGQNRMDGTVIADAVNIASRVEGLTKIYGTPLLITEQTYLKLVDPLQYHIRVIDAVKVKGKSEVVTVYEIFDAELTSVLALKDQSRNNFEEGFVLYHCEEYQYAQIFFENVLQVNPNDKAAQVYLECCQKKLCLTMPEKSTILIIKDIHFHARILSSFLTKNNFKVLVSNSDSEALQLVKSDIPHLILLDVIMPGMNGFETCKQLKANSQTQDIPIIFITSLTESIDKVKGFKLGAVDYITKPFHPDETLARINTHLKLSYLQRQLKFQKAELETNNLKLKEKIGNLYNCEL